MGWRAWPCLKQNALAIHLAAVGPHVPALADESMLQFQPVLRLAAGPRFEIEVSQADFDGAFFVLWDLFTY